MRGLFVLALALAACGSDDAPAGPALPTCADGEGLGVAGDGTLVCKQVPQTLPFPVCTSDQALSSAGGTFVCGAQLNGGPDVSAYLSRVAAVVAGVTSAEAVITQLEIASGAPAVFVGGTVAKSVGRVSFVGADTGLNASNAMCNSQFLGSHLCTGYEMYNTLVQGGLTAAMVLPKMWVYLPTGSGSFNGTIDSPFQGLEDNCGSYTYPTSDRGWRGLAVEWGPLPTGGVGLLFTAARTPPATTPTPCRVASRWGGRMRRIAGGDRSCGRGSCCWSFRASS